MLKPRKQNKKVVVSRHWSVYPYRSRMVYCGKKSLGCIHRFSVGLNAAKVVDQSRPFRPTGVGYILLADEQGNFIKGTPEDA
ncbi:hypothetical protein MLDJOKPK_00016 [Salmonella phage SPAsTU]|nr:hypothetical protein MLDJOKPK_00016 [Salmonella phage SPAsTU]